MPETVKIYRMRQDAVLPTTKSTDAAGYDLYAVEDFTLVPGQSLVVGTGIVVQPPPGYHTEILLRSSLAYKHNIMLRNSVGLIDRDYAGPGDELKLMLYRAPVITPVDGQFLKSGEWDVARFKAGHRIAQLVFRKTHHFEIEEVFEAPATVDRGGLGSTGK